MIITALQKWGLGVYGGRHLDRPVAFYKLSWLENKRRGEGGSGGSREKKTKKEIELMPKAAALNTVVFTSLL